MQAFIGRGVAHVVLGVLTGQARHAFVRAVRVVDDVDLKPRV